MNHLRVATSPTATSFPWALFLECHCPLVLLQRLQGRITIGNFSVQSHSSLIGPASSHIADCIATSSQHQHRQIKTFYKLHTLGMTCSKNSGGKGHSLMAEEEQTFQWNLIISVMPVQHRHCTVGTLTFDGQIKTTQPVPWQRIWPTLQDNCTRLERLHHFRYHLNKKPVVTHSPQDSVTATQ